MMRVGAGCETSHHEMRMDVISSALGDEAAEDEGLETPPGLIEHDDDALFEVDYAPPASSGAPPADSLRTPSTAVTSSKRVREHEEATARALPQLRDLVRALTPDAPISSTTLAQQLRVTKLVAEECLAALEGEGLVSGFVPALQARQVMRERSESASSGASDDDGASSYHSAHEDASPRKRRRTEPTTPTTPAARTPAAAKRKSSKTLTVPSTPGRQ